MHAAPLALAVMWPPFCDLPPLPGDGSGGGDTGGNSSQGGATGGGGAGSGGSSGDAGDPVLGCSAPEWPSKAELLPLPPVAFDDGVGEADLRKLSANGEVVIADYLIAHGDLYNEPDGHRPIFWNGGDWQRVDADTTGISTAVNCDGSVIAGRRSRLDGFIKTPDTPLVVLPGEEPWAPIPEAMSADGTRIGGNLTKVEDGPWAGETIPVWWTLAGEMWFFDPPEPRTLRHVSYDGSLVAGHRNICLQKFCDSLASLFVWSPTSDGTFYEDMPWSVMSSDLSTATGATLPPLYHHPWESNEVLVFRRPDQLTQLPCPMGAACDAVALSSRGNIVLVNAYLRAYLWTAERGFQDIAALLAADGVPFSELGFNAVDMSDDGRVILGSGTITHENGEQESGWFRVVLPRRVYEVPDGISDSGSDVKARR
ncbi:MAG: hypothetical protein M3020_08695 [Myxococcota bacterium]|nr:hypothetical protein [Myxococcota bacterium]